MPPAEVGKMDLYLVSAALLIDRSVTLRGWKSLEHHVDNEWDILAKKSVKKYQI